MEIKGSFVKLDTFLKLCGSVESGGQAKIVIQNGEVLVNGTVETRRGRKLQTGDKVSFNGQIFIVEKNNVDSVP